MYCTQSFPYMPKNNIFLLFLSYHYYSVIFTEEIFYIYLGLFYYICIFIFISYFKFCLKCNYSSFYNRIIFNLHLKFNKKKAKPVKNVVECKYNSYDGFHQKEDASYET